jgi:uncharacterized iron-regulated membrane protein
LAHRYFGLFLGLFLLVAGLTGALLAFYQELDATLNPQLYRVTPPQPGAALLEPFELERRVDGQPGGERLEREVRFDAEPGRPIQRSMEVAPDKWREVFIDPYTGARLGERDWGHLSEGIALNLMPFVYRLHYSLALDSVGTALFGVVALLWTVDCFVGAYLTFPAPLQAGGQRASWLRRWLPSWRLRTGKLFSLVFSWHRASGLWLWAVLLVFAWSAVGLNLHAVYRPVMATLWGFEDGTHERLPQLTRPYPEPRLSLREAHARGQWLMAEHARSRGFVIRRERALSHHADHGAYAYTVESSLDISSRSAQTAVYFDADSGRLLGFDAPTAISAGNTLTSWLYALHFAAVGGVWYRGFVSLMGLCVATLSMTGVWIWWRKRARRAHV